MSFRDRLERLKEKEIADALERQRLEEERARAEDARRQEIEKKRECEFVRLEKVAVQQLKPILQVLQEAYFEGKGDIHVYRNQSEGEVSVTVSLVWDSWSHGSTGAGAAGGNEITIAVSSSEYLITAGRKKITAVAGCDRRWQQKIENAVLSILHSKQYEWRDSWNNRDWI